MKYTVVNEVGQRFTYAAMGIGDAVEIYYATDGQSDEAPLVVGAFLIGNGWVL